MDLALLIDTHFWFLRLYLVVQTCKIYRSSKTEFLALYSNLVMSWLCCLF